MAPAYRKAHDLPDVIPVFPLSGALLLPRAPLPLNIFEPRYLNMVDDVLNGPRIIGMVQAVERGENQAPGLAKIGCAGRLTGFNETADGRYLISLKGICRYRVVEELETTTPYRQAKVDYTAFEHDLTEDDMESFDRDAFLETLATYLDANNLTAEWQAIENAPPEVLVNSLAMICPFQAAEKQALLEAETTELRMDALTALMKMGTAAGGADGPSGLQ